MCLFSGSRGAYVADFCAAGFASPGVGAASVPTPCAADSTASGAVPAPFFAALGGSAAVLFPGVGVSSGSSPCAASGAVPATCFAAFSGSATVLFLGSSPAVPFSSTAGVSGAGFYAAGAAACRAASASVSAVMPFPGVGAASSSAPCAAACAVFGAVPTSGFVVFGSFATVPPPVSHGMAPEVRHA
ncbi:hypothetical protein ACOSQ3_013267 [Xanthoceras sorbifolium]